MNNEENKNFQTLEEEAEEAKKKSESTLFAPPPPATKNLTKRQKQNTMKKQRRTIIILAIIVAAAIAAYFLVVLPIVNYVEEVTEETVHLLDGEELGTNDRILMFSHEEKGGHSVDTGTQRIRRMGRTLRRGSRGFLHRRLSGGLRMTRSCSRR